MFFKRNAILILLMLIGMIMFSSCKKEEEGKIVARVGKTTLTVEELLSQIPPQLLINASPETRRSLLDTWVSNELIYQDALRKEVDKKPEVAQQLEFTKKQIVIQAAMQDLIISARFIPESEARVYFREHEEEYNTNIEVSHISLNSMGEGMDILEKLKEGKNFASLARKYSTDSTTAKKDGYFGSFRKGDLIRLPLFEEYAFSLEKPGDITSVVQTEFGFDIIRLISHKKSREEIEYEDVAESIMQFLSQEKLEKISSAFIDSLRNLYKFEIHQEVLERELGIYSPISPLLPSDTR
ncbi:peptidylprolyl isomerase [candidate division WOR-3 bacterium]|nr:peptidylprolyl isomerase [candidate division WOR-3 bacterium]